MTLLAAAWRPGSSLLARLVGAFSASAWARSPWPATRRAGVLSVAPSASHRRRRGVPRDSRARITEGVAQLPVRAAITTLEPDASNHRAPGTRPHRRPAQRRRTRPQPPHTRHRGSLATPRSREPGAAGQAQCSGPLTYGAAPEGVNRSGWDVGNPSERRKCVVMTGFTGSGHQPSGPASRPNSGSPWTAGPAGVGRGADREKAEAAHRRGGLRGDQHVLDRRGGGNPVSGYFWPGWVLAGWGVLLLLDAWNAQYPRPITDEDLDRELRSLR